MSAAERSRRYRARKKTTVQAHRFVYELTFGEIPDGLNVCHRCDNPPCVRPDHLFAGTQRDNMIDKWKKGRGYSPFRERARQ